MYENILRTYNVWKHSIFLADLSHDPTQAWGTSAPVVIYIVRGCYEKLTGRTATKYLSTLNYCLSSTGSTIWNYDGTKHWTLSSNTDYLHLCKYTDEASSTTPLDYCNFKKASSPCGAKDIQTNPAIVNAQGKRNPIRSS